MTMGLAYFIIYSAVRGIVVVALVYAALVALTTWLVRTKRLSPFGAWPRLVRRVSEPVLLPLERRVIRAGGSPQDAPFWLLGIAVIGGLLLITLVNWLLGFAYSLAALSQLGPRGWVRLAVRTIFWVLRAAVFVRVIASWFGVSPYAKWMRPIVALTEWLLEPLRRVLPPFGPLDLSPLVAYLLLVIAEAPLLSLL
ncbi:MAG TPA: YggT family protein [Gemmatimonadales bacterium]|nr:YggT family protein [Gemmatimonadales bacterium]